jgi:hypothetical protein
VFLGAGVGKACGLPDVTTLQQSILDGLSSEQEAQLELQLASGNIEHALSRLRRISGLLAGGTESVSGLTAEAARLLDEAICSQIVTHLDVEGADQTPMLHFASWVGRSEYHLPLEVFTVNYDLLIETALESLGVAYFDGFVGALKARFRTDLVEAAQSEPDSWLPGFVARLWKLHGSVNWAWDTPERTDVVRLGSPIESGSIAAIYPSETKYEESRRVPFVVLQDHFRRALYVPESLVLVVGYSWRDEHLNELLIEAARRRPRSEIITFARTTIPQEVAALADGLPNLQAVTMKEAVLGGVRADWAPPSDALSGIWENDGMALGDFRHLSAFLAKGSPPRSEIDRRYQRLLELLGENAGA